MAYSEWSEPAIVETENQLTYSNWSASTTVKTNPSGITDLFDIEEAEFIFHEDEDYLEIKFDEPQWMNFIHFELKDVPLEWQVKYFNSDLNRVVSMTDWYGDDMRGQLVGRFTATEARDARTIRKVDDWIKFSYDIIPVKTSRVEFHFRRTGGRQAVNELEYRYSYAIRNVDLRYNIKEYDQVLPIRDDQVAIRNLLGYTERLGVRDWETQRAIDSQWETFWKSSPQPTANAIVPFYIDVRDKDGNAQLIDSVEVDPVYTGPSMNVYYSNDETLGRDFRLSRYKQDLQMLGTAHEFTTDGLAITGVDSAAYLQDNDYMRFDTERSFVLGLTYTIDAQSGGTLLDFGTVELQYDSQTFRLVANDGRVLIETQIDVYEGDRVAVNGGFIHKDDRFILGQDEYFQYDAMAVYDTFDTYDGQPIDDDLDGGWYLHITRLVFQPKFQRNSIAYLSGEEYNTNQPRIQNNTLLLEEGTENILSEAASWCNDWVSNGGSTLNVFLDVLDPYAERNAVRVEVTGGDSAYKARMPMADLSGTAAGQIVVRAYEKPIKVTPRDSGQEFIVRPDEGWHFLRWFSEPATGNDQVQIRALDPDTEEESATEDIVFAAAYAQYEYLDYHTSWQVGSQLRENETVIVPRDILNIGSTVYLEFIYPENPSVLMDAQGEFRLLVDYENIALQLHGNQITLDGANTGDRVSIAFSISEDLINLSMDNMTQGERQFDGISHSLSGINVESNVYIGSDTSGGQYINSAIYSFSAFGPGFIYTYVPVTEEYLDNYDNVIRSEENPEPVLEDPTFTRNSEAYLEGQSYAVDEPRFDYGVNLLPIKDQSLFLSDWNGNHVNLTLGVDEHNIEGSLSAKMEMLNTGTSSIRPAPWIFIPVTPGESYTISMYSYGEGDDYTVNLYHGWYIDGSWQNHSRRFDYSPGEFVRSVTTEVVPEGATLLRIYPHFYDIPQGSGFNPDTFIWISGLQIERGDEVTPWRPGGPSSILIEESTENLLTDLESRGQSWIAGANTTIDSETSGQDDPYDGSNAVNYQATPTSGNQAIIRPSTAPSRVVGDLFSMKVWIKNNDVTNNINVVFARHSAVDISLSNSDDWVECIASGEVDTDGSIFIQIYSEVDISLDIDIAFAQFEDKAYYTSWQDGGVTRSNERLNKGNLEDHSAKGTVEVDFYFDERLRTQLANYGSAAALALGSNPGSSSRYQLGFRAGEIGFFCNNGTTSRTITGQDASVLEVGWYRISIVWDEDNDYISCYVNGVLIGTSQYVFLTITSIDISGYNSSWASRINSPISSARLSNVVRSIDELEDWRHTLTVDENTTYLLNFENTISPSNFAPGSLWFDESDGYLYGHSGTEWEREFRETVTAIGDESREIYSYSFENDEENVFVADMLAQSLSKYDVGNMVEGIVYDFTLGSNSELTNPAGGKLQFVYVRQDRFSHILARKYAKSPERFTFLDGPMDRLRGDQNALFMARFLMGTEQDVARVGPNHKYYADKIWTPLYRDFKVRQGSIVFEPIHAKYVKLEFTDLVARPYKIDGENAVRRWYYDFPDWVHAYFEDIESRNFDAEQQGQGVPFEGNPIYDRTKHGMTMVDPVSGELVIFSTEPKKFYRTSYHDYKLKEMEQDYNQAFFVGLRNVKVYRRDFQVGDQPKIFDTFGDLRLVSDYTMNYLPDNEQFISTDLGQYVETVTFDSYSMYQTIQLAVQAAHWESQLSDKQLSLVTTNHLMSMNARSDNIADRITGEGAGKVLEARPIEPAEYGFRTKRGLTGVNSLYPAYDFADDPYDVGGNTYDDHFNILTANVRTSAIARIFLERANTNAVFELRLYQQEWLVSRKRFTNLGRGFHELELVYMSKSGDMDYQAEIVEVISSTDQMDTRLALDFLGIFQNPITWEVSNDGGLNWRYVLASINNYNGYIAFPQRGNQLRVRATAYRPGVVVSSYTVIPWYIESPVVSRSPIDYVTPDGVSELDDLRDTKHKPAFQLWHRWFPRKYSIEQHGRVPIGGEGFQP